MLLSAHVTSVLMIQRMKLQSDIGHFSSICGTCPNKNLYVLPEEVRQDHVILDGPSFFNINCHSKISNLL